MMESASKPELSEPEFTFPADEGELVAREYAKASNILEYGSGGSTVLAARSTNARILSIESDRVWANNLTNFLEQERIGTDRVVVHWANIGPTGKWGYPKDQSRWRKYPSYALYPWEKCEFSPDVVLIDGRFRLACLAATVMFAAKPTTILFDDYYQRNVYQTAEKVIRPVQSVGRMAKFEIEPLKQDAQEFATMVRWFFLMK